MPAAVFAVAVEIGEAAAGIAGAIGIPIGTAIAIGTFVEGAVATLGFASGFGAGLEAWAAVAAVAEALSYRKPKLSSGGSFQQFIADPQSPIPFVMGRFGVSGRAIYMTTSGGGDSNAGAAGNRFLTSLVVLSALGPIKTIESLKVNDTYLTFNGEAVNGGKILAGTFTRYATSYTLDAEENAINNAYSGVMWMKSQLGLVPSPTFAPPMVTFENAPARELTEWTDDHKLSGFAAAWWTLDFNAHVYGGGQPKPYWTLQGYSAYDPRLDSTYPGGDGPQRWGDRTTWGYSENPFIHALNYAAGFYYPDPTDDTKSLLYAGIGAGLGGVDVASLVAAANVADANGWTIGGGWTSDDDKFSVYTNMLAAGSGIPVIDGGIIGCIVNTPQTSLGTITVDQLCGPISVDTSASIRDRFNTVFPRYHSEAHNWDLVLPYAPVVGATYVTEDQGRMRSKTIDYQFVTDVDQACQLGAYDMVNSREGVVATLHGKPAIGAYPCGSCVTLNLPDAGLDDFKGVITKRGLDLMTGMVTLTVRSETDAKHAYALGQTGVAPATPQIGGVDFNQVQAPIPDSWAADVALLEDASSGVRDYVLRINGSTVDNVYASAVVVMYRRALTFDGGGAPLTYGDFSLQSFAASATQLDLTLTAGVWNVGIRYRTIQGAEDPTAYLDLGAITVPGPPTVPAPAPGAWVATGSTVGGETGTAPILTVTGAVDQAGVQSVIVDYRHILDATPTYGPWNSAEKAASVTVVTINVGAVGDYQVHVRYRSIAGTEDPTAVLDLGSVEVDAPQTDPLPNLTGLNTVYQGGLLRLTWDAVSDYRKPDYEIRRGAAWASSPPAARVTDPSVPSLGDGQYWLAAHYALPNGGGDIYSPAPVTITLAGSQLTSNVIAAFDEAATGWAGTLTNLTNTAGDLEPSAGHTSGTYAIPAGHRIAVGRVAPCNVVIGWTAIGQAVTDDVIAQTDMLAVADLLGGDLGVFVQITPQVRTSQDGGATWGDWSNWSPGAYVGSNFDFQVIVATKDASVIPFLTGFSVAVDVPDLIQSLSNQAVLAAGQTFAFPAPFNGGPAGAADPNIQISIRSASAGDTVVYSATLAGVTVQVLDHTGAGAARTVDIIAQGY